MTKNAEQIRTDITSMMVDALHEETPPWRRTWANASRNIGFPRNFRGRNYRGINPLILMWTSRLMGWDSKNWGTLPAWGKDIGVEPKAGQGPTWVVFFRFIKSKAIDPATGENKTFPLLKDFPIYNAEQMQVPSVGDLLDGRCNEGVPSMISHLLGDKTGKRRRKVVTKDELILIAGKHLTRKMLPSQSDTKKQIVGVIRAGLEIRHKRLLVNIDDVRNTEPDFKPAEVLIAATCAAIRHGGAKAEYHTIGDFIKMPPKRSFDTIADYYETMFHELVHWSVREGRVFVKNKDYAFHELVAEIGACFLSMEIGVPTGDTMRTKSKSYVKEWLSQMGNDPKYIFEAASTASRCVDYLLAFLKKENIKSKAA